MPDLHPMEQLREEFNRWAEAGRGEEMERHHRRIAERTLELMDLQPTENVLDIGCGAGWLAPMIAARVREGRVVGMDISGEMVLLARRLLREREECGENTELGHVLFIVGGVDEIPWEGNFFNRAVSVESAYYWTDPARGLREIFRVLREGGSAWVLFNYYRDNPHCHHWGSLIAVPTHLLWADEWAGLFRAAGFTDVAHRRIPDDTPTPEVCTGKWFRDAEQFRAFQAEGALLVHGTKPFGVESQIPRLAVL
jgi:ubiquinone/menaquinone biosynthesis C-methylase UbiE